MKAKFIPGVTPMSAIAALMVAALCSGNALAVSKQYLMLDSALINEERIGYWLKKRNQIESDATKHQVNQAVEHYIEAYKSKLNRFRTVDASRKNSEIISPGGKNSRIKMRVASPLKVDANTTIDVNVLAILIDFPDLKYNSNRLSPSDTEMYYSNYSLGHYRDMLYSATGFAGPGGENLLSSYQYYKDESGNSFNFTGQVYGWFTAQQDAEFYGGNSDSGDNNSDLNAGELVQEAVNAAVASGQVNLVDFDKEDPSDFDSDGNLLEPDGVIDHLLIFHSSIGEEAGGGVLAEDAIWSHRFYVGNTPQSVVGSNVKVDGYTIQPIDSAAGVVSHEFGHDLGLPDEYDTQSSDLGAPVGNWSVMASGSWLGTISGTEPSSFSPFARDFLQTTYGGKWINQLELDAKNLNQGGLDIDLVEAVNHLGSTNQVKVRLPQQLKEFKKPFSGLYQYYSTHNNLTTSKLSFSLALPNDSSLKLSMKAQWDIELDYDYVQILASGVPLANNFTKNGVNALAGISNVITGSSAVDQWQTLTFDLSAYAGQNVNFEISYVTDPFVGGFGFVADDIKVATDSTTVLFNGGETTSLTLTGFQRITDSYLLEPQNYYLQLRSHNSLDRSLAGVKYTPGVVMWRADSNFEDNHVDEHPGNGFLAVIDADQQLIAGGNSLVQVRDAAFGLYNQTSVIGDNHTENTPTFDDSVDYSSPEQPQSGVKIVPWAITMAVIDQATNSSSAKLLLSRTIHSLTAQFDTTKDGLRVQFNQNSISSVSINSYQWDFGDNSAISNLAAPTHQYNQPGLYNVSLTVSDVAGDTHTLTELVVVTTGLELSVNRQSTYLDTTFSAQVAGGIAPYQYQWNFGDNSPLQTGPEVSHTFAQAGTYQVEMTVSDDAEQVKILSFEYQVFGKVVPEFNVSVTDLSVKITNLSGGGEGGLSYLWDFGDGTTSTATNPDHTYSAAGNYQILLTVSDINISAEPVTRSITVTEPAPLPVPAATSGGSGGSVPLIALLGGLILIVRRKISSITIPKLLGNA